MTTTEENKCNGGANRFVGDGYSMSANVRYEGTCQRRSISVEEPFPTPVPLREGRAQTVSDWDNLACGALTQIEARRRHVDFAESDATKLTANLVLKDDFVRAHEMSQPSAFRV